MNPIQGHPRGILLPGFCCGTPFGCIYACNLLSCMVIFILVHSFISKIFWRKKE